MFGFIGWRRVIRLRRLYYHPEREPIGQEMIGVAPAWYGQPVSSFAEIGLHIAADSRFRQCAVETIAKVLLRRDFAAADYPMLRRLLEEFEGNELVVKPLIESVSRLQEYQTVTPSTEDYRSPKNGDALSALCNVGDLTGERWEYDTPLVDDLFRVMAGGVDGEKGFSRSFSPASQPLLCSSAMPRMLPRKLSARVLTPVQDCCVSCTSIAVQPMLDLISS